MSGGGGADTFVMREAQGGKDRILDFDLERDVVRVVGASDGIDDLTLTDTRRGVLVEVGEARLLILGVSADDLTEDHFDF